MSEAALPTPVGSPVRGLRGGVAHGPEKDWSKVGKTVPIQLTAPIEMIQWLRTNGYVPSWVFQEAARRLMGSGELDRLERQIEYHREQVTILEAARATLGNRMAKKESAEEGERSRLEAVASLAETFYAQGRGEPSKFSRIQNLRWVQGRLDSSKALRGSRADDTLALILSLKKREVET
ncbi:MAG TPA: hypothetical protein VGS23_03875 [Thermoplasmata archaeon]|nr:hypothetical protein [Thermoplasmata archaeon]